MKYTLEELQQLLSNLEAMEMRDDMDTLDQWEDYKDDNCLEEIYDICQSIIEETDNLNDYYNSL